MEVFIEQKCGGNMNSIENKKLNTGKANFKVCISDIIDRNRIKNESELEELVNILASSVGSLTNPAKLTRTFRSVKNSKITQKTIAKYLEHLTDAFLMDKAKRYDVKGKNI